MSVKSILKIIAQIKGVEGLVADAERRNDLKDYYKFVHRLETLDLRYERRTGKRYALGELR